MGAHVSACPNHQTGRNTPFDTRGVVALAGTFGYELDISKMSEEECDLIKQQVANYHKYYHIVANGKLYRLTDPFGPLTYAVWQQVSEDQSECLVFYVQKQRIPHEPLFSVRLEGLNPDKFYRNTENDEVFQGRTLMQAGLMLPQLIYDGDSILFHFEEVK